MWWAWPLGYETMEIVVVWEQVQDEYIIVCKIS